MKNTFIQGKIDLPSNVQLNDLLIKLESHIKVISATKFFNASNKQCIKIEGNGTKEVLHRYAKEIVSSMGGTYSKL